MRGCPNLEHLSYSDEWWGGPDLLCCSRSTGLRRLRSLILSGSPINKLVFRDLATGMGMHTDYHISAFLRALGPSLTHLELYSAMNTGAEGFCADLAQNLQLHSLVLSSSKLYCNEASAWIPKTLSHITSPSMNDIAIHLYSYRGVGDLVLVDWDALSCIFAKPLFSPLRKIQFKLGPGFRSDLKGTEQYIRQRLPGCDVRGILSVC